MTSSRVEIPVLKSRDTFADWQRKFEDCAVGEKVHSILKGTAQVPLPLTAEELAEIPNASRYTAKKDQENKIEQFNEKRDRAFYMVVKAMELDMLYGSADFDELRSQNPVDPAAAYQLVIRTLKPDHIDAQMTVDALITTLKIGESESPPQLIQRLAAYVQRLPVDSRPTEIMTMKNLKRAMKTSLTTWKLYGDKVDSLLDQEPAISYATFCTKLERKHDQILEEKNQEAALHSELKQIGAHAENEHDTALYTHGKGKGGRSGRGRGGRGRGRHLDQNQSDARIGSLYTAQGGKGHEDLDSKRPFWRGGGRQDGGRGYDFDRKGGRSGRGGGKGGGKGAESYYKPKFDGTCHKCGTYGHKEFDCYSKKTKY